MYSSWSALVKQRVRDAVGRSRRRGCSESEDVLFHFAKQILETQKKKCALCGVGLTLEKGDGKVASLDRIYSSVNAPGMKKCSYFQNSRWVCFSCNHATRSCHMKNALYQVECN